MVDGPQPGSKEAMEDGLQDGRMDHERSTRTMAVEQLMVLAIAHLPGHQAPRPQPMAYQMGLRQALRLLGTAEAIPGAPRPQPTNPRSIRQTTAGRINQRRMAGVPTRTTHQPQEQTLLLQHLLL
jgi:hypothetical protein